MRNGAATFAEYSEGTRNHQPAVIHSLFLQVVQEGHLVRKGIDRVAVEIVEAEQGIVQEAGRPGGRNNVRRTHLPYVTQGTCHFVLAFLTPEGLHHLVWELVD